MMSFETVQDVKRARQAIKPEQFSEERQEQVIKLLQSIDAKLQTLEYTSWMRL